MMREHMYRPQNGDRPNVPNIAIVVTDGISNSPLETIDEAGKVRSLNIVPYIIAVGIGFSNRPWELEKVANKPTAEWVFMAKTFSDLAGIKDRVAQRVMKVAQKKGEACATKTTSATSTLPPAILELTTKTRKIPPKPTPKTSTNGITPPTPKCEAAGDLVFVLDTSSSVTKLDFKLAKSFMKSLVGAFFIHPRKVLIGLILYGTHIRTEIPLGSEKTMDSILQAIGNISRIGGSTNTGGALKVLQETVFTKRGGDREEAPNVAIVMTDGLSDDPLFTKQEAKFVRDRGQAVVFAIGIGQRISMQELLDIVGMPRIDRMFRSKDFTSLPIIRDIIVEATCKVVLQNKPTTATLGTTRKTIRPWSQWLTSATAGALKTATTTTTTAITSTATGTTTSITPIAVFGATSSATEFTAEFTTTTDAGDGRSKTQNARITNVVFVLDASDSLSIENFESTKNFVKNVIKKLLVTRYIFRVGFVAFGGDVKTIIPIGAYSTADALIETVDEIRYIGGATNTAEALKALRKDVFANGDRWETFNVAIILTSGISKYTDLTRLEAIATRKNSLILAIVIGHNASVAELINLVGFPPRNRIFHAKDFSELSTLENRLVNRLIQSA